MSEMPFYTYVLRCADGSYYVGHTDNLEHRIAAHERGEVEGYSRTRRPVRLVFAAEFATREEALARERQIKGWSRAKKEALIKGNWPRLSWLSRGRGSASSPLPASEQGPFDKLRANGAGG
jgi:predicted GIY-YIG superfamily endonuclease